MLTIRLWQFLLACWVVSAGSPTRTFTRSNGGPPSNFVSSQNGRFMVNGKPLRFVGTNAYWLPTLLTEADIDHTLGSMAAVGVKVVRTWAFNDVESVPVNGTWFQLIANGTTKINEGSNGLQKLDTILRLAKKHDIYVLLALTNNWNPRPLFDDKSGGSLHARDVTPGTGNNLPRNTLSNDYGGMDVYVRNFGDPYHDQFYTNSKILSAFTDYVSCVVKRYANHSALFAWELANDPRCYSTLPNQACTPNTITKWHAKIAQVVKSLDPNHLTSSGNQGFFCVGCPKLYPLTPAQPQPTFAAGRRSAKAQALTKRQILEERRLAFKGTRGAQKRDRQLGSKLIRGRWLSPETRDAEPELGPAFDGSHGVDSEDIINIPQIGFGTFQLFPDQQQYGPNDPNLPAFNNTVQQGVDWIKRHSSLATSYGKPVALDGFGLVSQANLPYFVPFNSSKAPFGPNSATMQSEPSTGVTGGQLNDAYSQWFQAGLQGGLSGMIQYQWSQDNLMPSNGTNITPNVNGTTTSSNVPGTGVSPNDGYADQGSAKADVQGIIQQAAQQFGTDP